MQIEDRWLRFSASLFSSLLLFYPQEHRREYSEEMNQVFRDLAREIYAERGFSGLIVLWLKTLYDLLKTALQEQLKASLQMTDKKIIRLGSWAFVLAGFMAVLLSGDDFFSGILRLPGYGTVLDVVFYSNNLLYAVGLVGLYARFHNEFGRLGRIAVIVGTVVGLIGFTLVPILSLFFSPWIVHSVDYVIFFISWLVALIALFFLGIEAIRMRLSLQWKISCLIPGLAAFLFILTASIKGDFAAIWSGILSALFLLIGIGVFFLGFMLQTNLERISLS
jgi:hypothetical protein